jgi:uncharacterized glyoxalase superfamily protein PhnB
MAAREKHGLIPHLVVNGAGKAVEFYKTALGATEVMRFEGPGGTVGHAEIRIGDSVVMLGEENPQWGTLSPLSTNGVPASLHIYVANADAAFERALALPLHARLTGSELDRVAAELDKLVSHH